MQKSGWPLPEEEVEASKRGDEKKKKGDKTKHPLSSSPPRSLPPLPVFFFFFELGRDGPGLSATVVLSCGRWCSRWEAGQLRPEQRRAGGDGSERASVRRSYTIDLSALIGPPPAQK